MKKTYDDLSNKISKLVTNQYSTSFSFSSRLLSKNIRPAIYSIYGLVRFADEIVDSFHGYDKKRLLDKLKSDFDDAIEMKISMNPILNSFQEVYHRYDFDPYLVDKFFESMYLDLDPNSYCSSMYNQYIHGSAEVVGLMCLKVFANGDNFLFDELKFSAMKLGSAFQKVNFLRDVEYDNNELGRVYFPNVNLQQISDAEKNDIITDIDNDFNEALIGLKKLNRDSFFGVYVAYKYYRELLNKIKKINSSRLYKERVRISNVRKVGIVLNSAIKVNLGLI
tara:strand:+ start:434 stop:1270 length:837 start_codon:yes stop_codon:yes gene_type:complete